MNYSVNIFCCHLSPIKLELDVFYEVLRIKLRSNCVVFGIFWSSFKKLIGNPRCSEFRRLIERNFIFFKCIWEIRTDNPSLAVKILNNTPRPNVPSQAWLEIASDNHSRIFTTLLPQTAFIDSNLFIVYTHTYSTTTLVCTTDGWGVPVHPYLGNIKAAFGRAARL